MITPITPVAVTNVQQETLAARPTESHNTALRHAAQQFEAVFVRQLLTIAKVSGGSQAGGYNDMAIEALATGITCAGGLGLARQIEHALDKMMRND